MVMLLLFLVLPGSVVAHEDEGVLVEALLSTLVTILNWTDLELKPTHVMGSHFNHNFDLFCLKEQNQ